ncbi:MULTISPECIES: hypothetical protein [Halorussus]|uniref:DUF7504 family protein n=1 Tax=Halorussus TaxID=1070314 RepID=UPI0018777B44|nr:MULTISPECIES: hypothetical protein [Halorussus]
MSADVRRRRAPDFDERLGAVVDALSPPTALLVAGTVDPAEYALDLRLLSRVGSPDETAFVVATTGSREDVLAHTRDDDAAGVGSLAVVDTVSEDQYLTAPYADVPTVFMPSADDLERVVIGLSDLTGTVVPATGTRHLVVRSLTPMIEGATAGRVCRLLERTEGLRTGDGLGIFGIDYTAHDEETMRELTSVVDRLLWVSEDSDGRLQFELRDAGRRFDG